ncbi:monodechloroaminopyrrolnitrin synthase PrnB family protein [Actinorhabdospora filicis]|uniref:monodechloroaminopyrrolnitrin synthase PrnB family protein n=1 Tax=Actinorhabdospora filicis TaxID=1785913 RepID=UPI00255711C5|nr:monodechloroaminopyrrolnitrin synthase PrnB family protein [Actinorhabdospora filicis]
MHRHPLGAIRAYDRWLRDEFVAMNTVLEEHYFTRRADILPGHEDVRASLLRDGASLIAAITTLPDDPAERYALLGAVGYHAAACARHETGEPADLAPEWSLLRRLGTSLGVAPRYTFAHQALYNPAAGDAFWTFTSIPDERVFITRNGQAVLAYQRAAAALRRVPAMGVSNPVATYLLEDAVAALGDVLRFNRALAAELDPDRFYYCLRPYFKTHRVGRVEYRGTNAGDFAAINELDLLLGLCDPADPFYQEILAEKEPFLPPGDAATIQSAVRTEPLLSRFLREAADGVTPVLAENARLYLAACRAHGAAYAFHHGRLVTPFLVAKAPTAETDGVTASGPPLEAVVGMLARLSDLRAGRKKDGTAWEGLERLRELVG